MVVTKALIASGSSTMETMETMETMAGTKSHGGATAGIFSPCGRYTRGREKGEKGGYWE